ncbi:MAG: hypothetical protein OXU20_09235 [Myxococcales bacterium]|nr:hypothetical protein [Myxococcales bacterium]MDD9966208.1 hypothetical protein [Myxococcales bacterium]
MGESRLKPLSRVRAGKGLRRRRALAITRELEEALFRDADVLSEGYCRGAGGSRVYFGSTMITIDLTRLSAYVPAASAEHFAELAAAVDGSVRIRIRAMRLACAEVSRRMRSRVLGTAQVETRVRVAGEQLHIDVDLEVPVGVSSGSERS